MLCLLVQLWPAHVRAQELEPVNLEWTAPPECPQLEEVQARIRKLAGSRKSSALSLSAEATVTRTDEDVLHLHLVLHAGEMVDERNIEGRSCSALAGATAVAVALLFRSGALQSSDVDPTASAPTNEAAAGTNNGGPAKPPDTAPKTSRAAGVDDTRSHSRRHWRGLAQLPLGLLGIGPLRSPSLGVGIAGGAAFDSWRFLARGAWWFPEHASTSDDFQHYSAEVRRTAVTLLACRALLQSRVELAPCATLSIEHLSARGQGAHISAHTAQTTWVAAGLGAQARVHVASWLNLLLGVEGELETSRPRLFLDGVGQVATLLPVAASMSLGSEWIF